MDENELRLKIYERLGLEVGNLASESGNDWVRAEKEILEEYKQEQLNKISEAKGINYITIDKNSKEFLFVLNTDLHTLDWNKIQISNRKDLNDFEIKKLIELGSKDVLINLVREHKLTDKQIELIIPKSVYMVKKLLVELQDLNASNRNTLVDLMNTQKNVYQDLLTKLEQM